MNKSNIMLAGLIMIILSCSDSEDPKPIYFNVEEVHGKYLVDKEEHIAYNAVWGGLQFSYDRKKLVKRVGGCYVVYSVQVCLPEIYDTLMLVNKNTLRILGKESIKDLTIVPFEREITFEKGLMKRKISAKNLASATESRYYLLLLQLPQTIGKNRTTAARYEDHTALLFRRSWQPGENIRREMEPL